MSCPSGRRRFESFLQSATAEVAEWLKATFNSGSGCPSPQFLLCQPSPGVVARPYFALLMPRSRVRIPPLAASEAAGVAQPGRAGYGRPGACCPGEGRILTNDVETHPCVSSSAPSGRHRSTTRRKDASLPLTAGCRKPAFLRPVPSPFGHDAGWLLLRLFFAKRAGAVALPYFDSFGRGFDSRSPVCRR